MCAAEPVPAPAPAPAPMPAPVAEPAPLQLERGRYVIEVTGQGGAQLQVVRVGRHAAPALAKPVRMAVARPVVNRPHRSRLVRRAGWASRLLAASGMKR